MKNKQSISLKLILFLLACNAHSSINMNDYEGQWQGKLAATDGFNLTVRITPAENQQYKFELSNQQHQSTHLITNTAKQFIDLKVSDNLRFKGRLNNNKELMRGFIQSGLMLYHIQLELTDNLSYVGTWPLFMVDPSLNNSNMFMSIEDADSENYAAYTFFGDQRFTGTWCSEFSKNNDNINFRDMKTGLEFRGRLKQDHILIDALLAGQVINSSTLKKSTNPWKFGPAPIPTNQSNNSQKISTDWPLLSNQKAKIQPTLMSQMEQSILADKKSITDSVLIAIDGQLAYEKYFNGFNADVLHDQRSASKSIASAMVGIAIDKKIFTDDNQQLFTHIPKAYQNFKNSQNSEIKIKDLLTMSSGIDAIDFGNTKPSAAAEDTYQPTPDWLKTVLSAPMLNKPGTQAYYGSANPYLLSVMLQEALDHPLELFIDKHLMQPLGIDNYIIQTDIVKQPYFGGGMYFRPRDMLKFGQLYLNKGLWQEKRILAKAWVKQSTKKHTVLENTPEKDAYGYLWWHKTYAVNGVNIDSIEARGAGGQYIFILPKINTVAVITSGNYRNGLFKKPEFLMQHYILPAITQSTMNDEITTR